MQEGGEVQPWLTPLTLAAQLTMTLTTARNLLVHFLTVI
jgi:hypothetical protein